MVRKEKLQTNKNINKAPNVQKQRLLSTYL